MKKVPASRVRLARVFKRAAERIACGEWRYCCAALKARLETANEGLNAFQRIYDKAQDGEHYPWWFSRDLECNPFEARIFALLLACEFVLTDRVPRRQKDW